MKVDIEAHRHTTRSAILPYTHTHTHNFMYTRSTHANKHTITCAPANQHTITCAPMKFLMRVGEKFLMSRKVSAWARGVRAHTRGHLDVGVETHEADACSQDEASGALEGIAE